MGSSSSYSCCCCCCCTWDMTRPQRSRTINESDKMWPDRTQRTNERRERERNCKCSTHTHVRRRRDLSVWRLYKRGKTRTYAFETEYTYYYYYHSWRGTRWWAPIKMVLNWNYTLVDQGRATSLKKTKISLGHFGLFHPLRNTKHQSTKEDRRLFSVIIFSTWWISLLSFPFLQKITPH